MEEKNNVITEELDIEELEELDAPFVGVLTCWD